MAGRRSQPGGLVLPSPVVALSIVAVLMAAIAFVVTRGDDSGEKEVSSPPRSESTSQTSSDPTDSGETEGDPSPEPEPTPEPKPRKKLDRGEVFVEVYNNTSISGLAGDVGETATNIGWQVVGVDNWLGTIPSNTVYYPARLKRAARVLARDLGIDRVEPADGAMKLDRLTVILTGAL
ncbi:LytR C-terminal domain-containing protein [Nocardioides sp. R-C-SC26]|uniref:LytR C-terminal domain-containing protein n=1 Tax=Nocardioides sp. R-C-SC26 TaxID=2870414 RepID=UPI001E425AAE|nr:LytR C-terminal domain-containing protein [Nocardioides sp. R-C-SC26]